MRALALAAASAAIALATACSNDSTFGGTPCPALGLAPPTLLYPQPGATKVPTSIGIIILANIGPLGGSVTLMTTGSTVAAGTFGSAPSPLPSGAAEPPPGATAPGARPQA